MPAGTRDLVHYACKDVFIIIPQHCNGTGLHRAVTSDGIRLKRKYVKGWKNNYGVKMSASTGFSIFVSFFLSQELLLLSSWLLMLSIPLLFYPYYYYHGRYYHLYHYYHYNYRYHGHPYHYHRLHHYHYNHHYHYYHYSIIIFIIIYHYHFRHHHHYLPLSASSPFFPQLS